MPTKLEVADFTLAMAKSHPPGWDCNQIGQAYGPLPGWHGETDKVSGCTLMMPNNLARMGRWQPHASRSSILRAHGRI
jgi:hypothetical protein